MPAGVTNAHPDGVASHLHISDGQSEVVVAGVVARDVEQQLQTLTALVVRHLRSGGRQAGVVVVVGTAAGAQRQGGQARSTEQPLRRPPLRRSAHRTIPLTLWQPDTTFCRSS